MRFLVGIVLGAALTIGAAYYRDSTYASPAADPPVRPIVNWDVASEVANHSTQFVRQEFDRILGR